MNETIDNTKNHERANENFESTKEKRPTSAAGKKRTRTGGVVESWTREKDEKNTDGILPTENESYRNLQALLLAVSVLVLSYHGFRYGRTEYSVLENGHIVNGYVSARRTVVTFSVGYSIVYSIVSTLTACMLLYSLLSKKPRWSLPSIIVYMTDLVCHVADALVAFWLFFTHLRLMTALLYTTATALIITGELWIWLGVLRLYEFRTFK